MIHEFHFVLSQKFYFKLLKLSKRLNKNISTTLVIAVEKLIPFIEKNHLSAKEKECRYKILEEPLKTRYHIHCYLPEKLYNKLKQIHLDLDTYSIAQILRKIIEAFLMGSSKYGEGEFLIKLEKCSKIWEMKKMIFRNEKRVFIKQMSYKIKKLSYCVTTYGNDSRPYLIQLL
jgi:hypothetical protein